MQQEPVFTANTIVALVTAIIGVIVAFGVPMTDEQKVAVVTLVGVVAPFVAAWWARQQVTPLVNPRDQDGAPLSRSDNSPTIAQTRALQVK